MREHVMIWGIVWLGLTLPLVPTTTSGQTSTGDEDREPTKTRAERKASLRMTAGVVCRSIDGYEDYKVLPKAAQTSDEKLLVYFRPLGFQSELVDGSYEAHLVPDFQIRKRGEKAVLLQKMKMYTYKPKGEQPPRYLYMKNAISLKGLAPGEYELTLILHDEIAKGPPATQVVRFRVIPATEIQQEEKASQSEDRPALR
jgi:hypothetical protein